MYLKKQNVRYVLKEKNMMDMDENGHHDNNGEPANDHPKKPEVGAKLKGDAIDHHLKGQKLHTGEHAPKPHHPINLPHTDGHPHNVGGKPRRVSGQHLAAGTSHGFAHKPAPGVAVKHHGPAPGVAVKPHEPAPGAAVKHHETTTHKVHVPPAKIQKHGSESSTTRDQSAAKVHIPHAPPPNVKPHPEKHSFLKADTKRRRTIKASPAKKKESIEPIAVEHEEEIIPSCSEEIDTVAVLSETALTSSITFENDPVKAFCGGCNCEVITETRPSVGRLTYVASLLCLGTGCCLMPFCMESCQDVQHNCPKCRSCLGMYKKPIWPFKKPSDYGRK